MQGKGRERRKGLQGINQNKERKTSAEACLGCVLFAPKPRLCIRKIPTRIHGGRLVIVFPGSRARQFKAAMEREKRGKTQQFEW